MDEAPSIHEPEPEIEPSPSPSPSPEPVPPPAYMIVDAQGVEIDGADCIIKAMRRFKRSPSAKHIIRRADGAVLAYRGQVVHEPKQPKVQDIDKERYCYDEDNQDDHSA